MKKILIGIGITCFFSACFTGPFNCDEWANGIKDGSETNIIINKIERNGPLMYLYGKDPITGNQIEFYEGSGWVSKIYHRFKMGDTIVKKKGEYNFLIKRKGATITIPLICDETGKTYKDK